MKQYRVAMVAACPFPAAFASSGLIREMTLALKQNGHDVHVITYHLGNQNFPVDEIPVHRIHNVPGYTKSCSGITPAKPVLDLLLAFKLLQISRKYHFDIIHTHNYEAPPAGYLTRFKLNIPVIYHAHNTMRHELPSYFRNPCSRAVALWSGSYLDRLIPHRADHIITVSQEQTDYLTSIGIPGNRLTLIPPSVSAPLFAGGDGSVIRKRLGIGDSPLMIYTGGLQPYQNCLLLIELLNYCVRDKPDLHLVILARSEDHHVKEAAKHAGISNRIHFLQGQGLTFERDCLAAADIGIIPRIHCIGFPVKLLNYAAAGVPIVCFESLRKGFSHEKELLAAPDGDVREMAQCVLRLLNNPELGILLADAARTRLITHHNWPAAIRIVEAIYDRVTSVRSTRSRQ